MSMKEFEGSTQPLTDTSFGCALSMIGGEWRLMIIYWLIEYDVIHFNELQRPIGTITCKTLSSRFRETEAGGLLTRAEHPRIPPRVEYRLLEKGRPLYPIVEAMCAWDQEHQENTK